MTLNTVLKLGQVVGALLLAAGVASCSMKSAGFAGFFIAGAVVYGGCRLALWLRRP